MSYSVKLEKIARNKQKSRDIVREVLNFGVDENQKLDIMHGIALSLENNKALKELSEVLKKYRETINKEEDSDNNSVDTTKKIILE